MHIDNKKQYYDVKYFDSIKQEWVYASGYYLNMSDNQEEKNNNINKIKKQLNIPDGMSINISNFFNVYC